MGKRGKDMERTVCFSSLFFRQRLNNVGLLFLFGVALWHINVPVVLIFSFVPFFFGLSFLFEDREKCLNLRLAALGIVLSLLAVGYAGVRDEFRVRMLGTATEIQGTVTAVTEDSYDVTSHGNSSFCGKIRVYAREIPALGMKLTGRFRLVELPTSDAVQNGVFLFAEAEEYEKTGEDIFLRVIGSLRERIAQIYSESETGGFYRAVLLGDRSGLTASQTASFRDASSSHLLAISGLHFTMILSVFFVLIRLLPIDTRGRTVILLPLCLVVLFLCGASVSVFRSALMSMFAMSSRLWRRRSDSVTALVFAACLIVLREPYAMTGLSFQFSFLSTFSILTVSAPLSEQLNMRLSSSEGSAPIRRLLKFALMILTSFLIPAAALVFTLPIQLVCFGEFQPFSALYSLLIVPLFAPCLMIGIFTSFTLLVPVLKPFAIRLSDLVAGAFLKGIGLFAESVPDGIETGAASLPVALLVTGILLFFVFGKKPVYRVFFLWLLIVLVSLPFLI